MVLIIADDFTGALDAGIKFAEKGCSVDVYIYDRDLSFSKMKEPDVLIIDAETRHLSPKPAYQRVYELVSRTQKFEVDCYYKKTDSALRGNIGSELSAMLDAAGDSVLHFLPAFPAMNRIVKNGHLFIDHIPVNQTAFGRDIYNPVSDSCIANIISQQTNIRVSKAECFPAAESEAGKKQIKIYDASTDQDLADYAEILFRKEGAKVFAGCMGFARAIAGQLHPGPGNERNIKMESLGYNKCIVVCGSIHPISKAQLSYAEARGIRRMKLKDELLYRERAVESVEGMAYSLLLYQKVMEEKYVLLETDENTPLPALKPDELRKRISDNLAAFALELLNKDSEILPLIIGGDTLFAVFHLAGIKQIRPLTDLGDGIVLSEVSCHGQKRHVISKSGGFGKEDAIIRIINACMKK